MQTGWIETEILMFDSGDGKPGIVVGQGDTFEEALNDVNQLSVSTPRRHMGKLKPSKGS